MTPQLQIPDCYSSAITLAFRSQCPCRGEGWRGGRGRHANRNFCSAFFFASTRARTRAALSRLIERSSPRPSAGTTRKFKLKFISALHFGRVASLLDELLRATMFPRYTRALFLDVRMIPSFSLSLPLSLSLSLRRVTRPRIWIYGEWIYGVFPFFLLSPFSSLIILREACNL